MMIKVFSHEVLIKTYTYAITYEKNSLHVAPAIAILETLLDPFGSNKSIAVPVGTSDHPRHEEMVKLGDVETSLFHFCFLALLVPGEQDLSF